MANPAAADPLADRIYDLLTDDDEERVCEDIPEAACTDVPANFFLQGGTKILTRLGDEVANAKTVLPWLLATLGTSEVWISWLVPIRESMSMLPQLVIANVVERSRQRKWAWIVGSMLQALALLLMAASAWLLTGAWAGMAVLLCLLGFSLARAVCSIASKDLLGRTIPKRRRGRLSGYTVAISGVLTVGAGALLGSQLTDTSPAWMFAMLLAGAASLWLLAAALMWRVREVATDPDPPDSALGEMWSRLRLIREDAHLRRFIIARGFLISTALAAPYYVIIARQAGAGESLGVFVIASGLAAALGSAFWGRFADTSSRKVWLMSGASASALGVLFFLVVRSGLLSDYLNYLAPAAFFLLAIAHGGVRVGRKTYIVDLADEGNRIDYVAVSNTVIGAFVLLSGLLGLLTPFVGAAGMLLLLSLMGLAGVAVGFWLPEAE